MRVYTVQPGDSPASIAAQDAMAGCPKCSIDLVRANPHKATVTLPNGFKTFRELAAGEKLNVPAKWSSKEFEDRPPAYFQALPHADGVTPSTLGDRAAGVLNDYATLDAATASVAALGARDDQSFANTADATGTLIDQAVREADSSVNPSVAAYATATHTSTDWARQQNQILVTALNANDQAGATVARAAVQTALATALASAQLALQAVYGNTAPPSPAPSPVPLPLPTPLPSSTFPPELVAAAQAAATAITTDPNFCSAVAQPGSAVNTAVHVFKGAWNTANPNNQVPISTGNYEQATADVLARVLGSAPPACPARVAPAPAPSPSPSPSPSGIVAPGEGLSVGAILGLGLLGAGVVGGAVYLATQTHSPVLSKGRRRRSPSTRPRKRAGGADRAGRHWDYATGTWKKD